jgi:acetolactate synthase-1/2/3 large subunit
MSAFADWTWQAPAVPRDPTERRRAARQFLAQLRRALAFAAAPPSRPAIFGLPQDVADQRWLPLEEIASAPEQEPSAGQPPTDVDAVASRLARAERPLFLLDDYALRFRDVRGVLDEVSRVLGAPVLQVRHRRGPMLFERLRTDEVEHFVGWLNPFSAVHTRLLDSCDLLVTLEDRNLYERVVGRLPGCPKLAINSDPVKARKNEYLQPDDMVVVGSPTQVLAELARRLPRSRSSRAPWFPEEARAASLLNPDPAAPAVEEGRRAIVRALAKILAGWERPVLIDDSQMFGGLLSEHYDELPRGLRVFGGHGAFVGSGLASATGLAIGCAGVQVMCTLGDQAFTNSFQGLVAARQEHADVLFIVCNNGESVSLKKQAAASYGMAERPYLSNVPGFEYHVVARALGIRCERVSVPVGGPTDTMDGALAHLSRALGDVASVPGPRMVELVLPPDPEVWRGIWITQGFEQLATAVAS